MKVFIDRTKNKSDRYQAALVESAYSPDVITKYAEADMVETMDHHYDLRDELDELWDELKKEYWRLVDTELTQRQAQVLHLYAKEKTQTEIAKILNVNQSSVTKSMNGNCDYRKGKRIYGGANKKLRKLAANDEKIQKILLRMKEIQEELEY